MTCKLLETNYDGETLSITFQIPSQVEPFIMKATPKEWIEAHYARRILLEMSNTLRTNLADVREMVEP